MNILIATQASVFHNQIVGGAETSLKLLGEYLADEGHAVHYLTINLSLHNIDKLEFDNKGVSIKIIQPSLPSRLALKVLYKITRSKQLYDFFIYRCFKQAIDHLAPIHNYDIAHCFYEAGIMDSMIALKNKYNFKIVVRIAGLKWVEEIQRKPSHARYYEKIFNHVDGLNFISTGIELLFDKYVNEFGIKLKTKPKITLDIGVSTKALKIQWSRSPSRAEGLHLVMVARFSDYQKRQDLLIDALALLPSDLNLKLTFIGEGVNKDFIQQRVNELGLQDKVVFLPFFNNQKKLWNTLATSDFLVHACEYEGLGKIIIEALAVGLPVLVSDVSPLNRYIKDGFNGFIVENTAEAWAEAISRQYHDRKRLDEISINGQNYVQQKHDPVINVKNYEIFFNSLLSKDIQN